MTTATAIDTLLSYTDNVDATDADNANRRLRFLQYLQEAVEDVWNYYDWTFKYSSGTVAVGLGDDDAALPGDFAEFGNHGGIWLGAQKVREVAFRELITGKQTNVFAQTSNPAVFALASMDAATGSKVIWLPVATGAYTLDVFYITRPLTLLDADDLTGNLWSIPTEYHNTVLLPGAAHKIKRDQGESGDYWSQYERGLAYMVKRERERKTTVSRMPRAVSSW